ncbi:MAG: hypothetical protein K2N34_10560 [Lachnospiraceae bacterium]|nr:hypothetical protein [Lachnospiraceae bacterium]
MEHVTCGESPEYIEELMVNRYLANGYAAEDALTAYIYCTSVVGLVYGVTFQQLLEYFASIVPDAETDRFNKFVEEKEGQYKTQIYQNMCRKLERKFEQWDEDKDITQLDKNSMAKIFNEMFVGMEDDTIKELMDNICNLDICHSLLGAREETRRHIVELIPFSNRFYLLESWMNIPFNEEATENCLAAMGRVVYVWTAMKRDKK